MAKKSQETKAVVLRAPPRIKTEITRDIVDTATQKNSSHCMIAEAIKKSHPRFSHVSVDIQTIRATDAERGERYVWLTPREAQHLIIDFDQGKKPAPFVLKLGAGQTVPSNTKSAAEKSKMRKAYHKKYSKKAKAVRMVRSTGSKSKGGHRPDILGGREPPQGIAARREFGLRGLAR